MRDYGLTIQTAVAALLPFCRVEAVQFHPQTQCHLVRGSLLLLLLLLSFDAHSDLRAAAAAAAVSLISLRNLRYQAQ
jgi:hypothetical protein